MEGGRDAPAAVRVGAGGSAVGVTGRGHERVAGG